MKERGKKEKTKARKKVEKKRKKKLARRGKKAQVDTDGRKWNDKEDKNTQKTTIKQKQRLFFSLLLLAGRSQSSFTDSKE